MNVTLKCQVNGEFKEVEMAAKKFGPLCVHKTFKGRRKWTVTHIATGFAVYRYFKSEAVAVGVAKKLRGLAWDFKTMKAATRRTKLHHEVREVVLKAIQ